MSAKKYQERALEILHQIAEKEKENIKKASEIMAESIASGHLVHLFGSGHSAIPALDIFPRYGSYVGFHPLIDPRLIWFNVIGPGGARELLWIERQEGYIKNFLQSFNFYKEDSMVVFSHGGLNAAPIEAALYAKAKGMKVIAVTSMDNYRQAKPTHSSGKKLADIADVVIDNCAPLEDAIVEIEGQKVKVGASSTLSTIFISMSLLCETAKLLSEKGIELSTFVSPNVSNIPKDNNDIVYQKYTEYVKNLKV
ncbi:MAG: SIS domain-containing protein [Thermosediminibacteraceae bacterium]|nr:SIS domain-containing protein [Thermosediminibacteraceae bacterium]